MESKAQGLRTFETFLITCRVALIEAGSAPVGQGPRGPLDKAKGLFTKEEFGRKELGRPVPYAVGWVAEAGREGVKRTSSQPEPFAEHRLALASLAPCHSPRPAAQPWAQGRD